MTAAAALAFPGGRTLAAWWRQLAGHHPGGLWVGYLTFHRVETPVIALRPHRLPPLEMLVLKGVAARTAPAVAGPLAERLGCDAGLVERVLRHLDAEGLLVRGAADVTASGREALAHGHYPRPRRERPALYFWHADWTMPPSTRFVQLPHPERLAWLPAPETRIDVADLHACVRQPAEWKVRHGFPAEIREVLAPTPGLPALDWEQVAIATPLRMFAAVVQAQGETGPALTAWTANPRNWELQAVQPAFSVPDDVPGWFPPAITEAQGRAAFVEWCQQRQLPTEEAERCQWQIEGERFVVRAPAEWREKLHGESWLLIGEGLLRAAVRVDFA